jgi:hypothetical protein
MESGQDQNTADFTAAKLSLFKRYLNEIIIIALSSVVIFLFLKLMSASDEVKIYISKDQTDLIKTNMLNTLAIEKNTAQMQLVNNILIQAQDDLNERIQELEMIVKRALELENRKANNLRMTHQPIPNERQYDFKEIIKGNN